VAESFTDPALDDEATVVAARSSRSSDVPESPESPAGSGVDGDLERTVVVDRSAAHDGVAQEDDLERTVVVAGRESAPGEPDDDSERTVVVQRGDDSEQTVVVQRGDDSERTVVVQRGDDSEQTVVVGRRAVPLLGEEDDEHDTDRTVARPRPDLDGVDGPDAPDGVDAPDGRAASPRHLPPVPSLRRRGSDRRRGLAAPPVPVGFVPPARVAVGPGAVEHYAPRELPPPPGDRIEWGAMGGSTRGRDASLPSVARRAGRTRVVAIVAFVTSCVVSVCGLAVILLWAF